MRFSSLVALVVVTASLALGGCASSTETDPVEETVSNLTDDQKDIRAVETVKLGELAELQKAEELQKAAQINKLGVGRPELEPRPGFEKK